MSNTIEKEISVIKSGIIRSYILSDLKPCIEADVLIDGVSVHIPRVLFDTGANMTVINPASVPDPSTGTNDGTEIIGARSSGQSSVHYCNIILGSGDIVLSNVKVCAFDLDVFDSTDIELIIGMDVITLGILTISKPGSVPVFTFEV